MSLRFQLIVCATPLTMWIRSQRKGLDRLFALIIEVRVHPGATLVMTGKKSPAEKFVRPDICTRLTWGAVFHIKPLEGDMWKAISGSSQGTRNRGDGRGGNPG